VEVVGVELVGNTDLGIGRDKRMEYACNGSHESGSKLASA
jgi:hypothetical protein